MVDVSHYFQTARRLAGCGYFVLATYLKKMQIIRTQFIQVLCPNSLPTSATITNRLHEAGDLIYRTTSSQKNSQAKKQHQLFHKKTSFVKNLKKIKFSYHHITHTQKKAGKHPSLFFYNLPTLLKH